MAPIKEERRAFSPYAMKKETMVRNAEVPNVSFLGNAGNQTKHTFSTSLPAPIYAASIVRYFYVSD
jgi:hypothetical protein